MACLKISATHRGMIGTVTYTSSPTVAPPATGDAEEAVLDRIAQRVLWLSTAMVHQANRVRPNSSGMKVGGHQASSASMVSIMTSLWFGPLTAADRVSVKPHAAPVLHAVNYLLGELDADYLPTLRQLGGLQSYPSRQKDPDPVDYSTGSVGIGATATIWGAIARRYVHGGAVGGRQYALIGDAELDEGAVWEAVLDPATSELGELVWIVDLNRQSLDRVVPHLAVERLQRMFAGAGWQVLTVKYGRLIEEIFERPGGARLRQRVDGMANQEYQRLLRCSVDELRERLPGGDPELAALLASIDDDHLIRAVANLGGHDIGALNDAYRSIDDSRPTVIFAYTVKGFGLPVQGHPHNHSALLSNEQFTAFAEKLGLDADAPWATFLPGSAEGLLCEGTAARLHRDSVPPQHPDPLPVELGRNPSGLANTQSALGRALLDLTRADPAAASRVVTVSPDVSSSTNLGGWVNKVGVWACTERLDWFSDDPETILHWRETPAGQHVELGIAETNLVGLLGELGATWSRWGKPLIPIGVLYDPFVARALEPWTFGIYAGGQSILVGTPSGVTLAPEGGAHQSITTPSIGLEQPGLLTYEPAFAVEAEWALLACMDQIGRPGGKSAYLRLSTRQVDQSLAAVPTDPAARERRRRQVIAGAYPLRRTDDPAVTLVAMGAMVTEALDAATRLAAQGVGADVVCVTSPGQLFAAVQARDGRGSAETAILDQAFPAERAAPMVTLLDGHPHTLAFLATIQRVPLVALGVSTFGQSGDLQDVYRAHGIDADAVVTAALDVLRR